MKILPAIVIGSSTGGTRILEDIIKAFPSDLEANVFVVQHIPVRFVPRLAERITRLTGINVVPAKEGDKVDTGKVYIAPGDFHMLVKVFNNQVVIALSNEQYKYGICPSIDITMKSVVEVYGSNVIGVILSGMGDDGLEGVKAIKLAGGKAIVQDPNDSIIRSMPETIIEEGLADTVCKSNDIGNTLISMLNNGLR